ncbi:MAG: DNA polymerase III subunit delta' [Gammaproteobacteria bacterium RIFOXYA12_FULL_61_12]|nr:MAG: DNA polymerase III subunit delta' [Gammaproteobacteria bacterium RIFOXYA12_FULL_61_12]OGT91257.1 MAG: DNA polymerase III subunit delta' [Gammaproteobacteria bacterium RIFOXYD12_FULL_61_37]
MNYLPWQQSQWHRMRSLHRQGRIPHALLFQGPEGVGKRLFAEAFGRGLLCLTPGDEGAACGQCRACLLLQAGTHPDLSWVEPEEEGKAIRIDRIREFTRRETISSQFGGHKIWIIRPADAMNDAASNALLKTLEEPTPSTLILLLTSRPGALPATIRSRCQSITFPVPPKAQALAWLGPQGEQDWATLLAVSAGAPFKALALADPEKQKLRSTIIEQLLKLFAGGADPIALAEEWHKRDLPLVLQWITSLLVDLVRLAANTGCRDLFNPDALEQLLTLAAKKPGAEWQGHLTAIYPLSGAIERQLNMQLQLEALLLSFTTKTEKQSGVR